ncbi:type II secretion system GspH family protein [Patescibacteria group bacterium]|nr:type II secretion system GspH family protein [Patescibacteria group bacterium]
MVLKTHSEKGITIVELSISIAIFLILLFLAITYFDPAEKRQRARDTRRVSDLEVIDRAINEYLLDNQSYPDASGTLRQSNILPLESTSLENAGVGWIPVDFTDYISMLPTDPINDETYHYYFMQTSDGYELNAVLEYELDLMVDDGGNDDNYYEIGNNLTIISP